MAAISARVLLLTRNTLRCGAAVLGGLLLVRGDAAEVPAVLQTWIAAQTNVQTWSADLTQIRSFKALAHPLVATGHVWFASPNRFRWQLGNPPETIAVRRTDDLLVIYPKLQRAERYPLSGGGAWRDTLALLEAGFPKSRADWEAKFRFRAEQASQDVVTLALEPKSSAARRMMPELKVAFSTNDFSLRATELRFADGSVLKNVFTNAQVNVTIDPALFEPQLPPDYKIVEPLKKP